MTKWLKVPDTLNHTKWLKVPDTLNHTFYKTSTKKVAKFLEKPFNFDTIQSKMKKIAVIHGDNDKNVSHEQGVFLAKELGVKLITVKNGGHLDGSSGWTTLPQALEALTKMFSK